jgi:hypothetical protein
MSGLETLIEEIAIPVIALLKSLGDEAEKQHGGSNDELNTLAENLGIELPEMCQQVALVARYIARIQQDFKVVREIHHHSPTLAIDMLEEMKSMDYSMATEIDKAIRLIREHKYQMANKREDLKNQRARAEADLMASFDRAFTKATPTTERDVEYDEDGTGVYPQGQTTKSE